LAHPVALAGPLFAAASTADLVAARSQMALTLGFHIVLACLGVALPTLMLIAEGRGLRRGDADAMLLARRWSSIVAVTFAVGAVSGTVLSFELGLLWPGLMGQYGAAYGIPSRSRASSSSSRRSSWRSTSTAGIASRRGSIS
jgi:cytochrome bd ubiquinol oxidase subunit I